MFVVSQELLSKTFGIFIRVDWVWMYCVTHHIRPTLHHRIYVYPDRYEKIVCDKKYKIEITLKMESPDTLLQNQLIFVDPTLKIRTLDGKRC